MGSFDNVSVETVKYPSPILACYKYIETAEPGTYAMAGVRKGKDDEDYKRVLKFVENFSVDGKYYERKPKGVNVIELPVNTEPLYYKGRTDKNEGMPISASILRRDILNDDYENFKTNYPGYSDEITKNIWEMLKPVVIEADIPEYENELYETKNAKQITGVLNRHMTHAEDLVLTGKDGLSWVIDMFKRLHSQLKGNTNSQPLQLSVKFDGAQSVFVWSQFPGLEKEGVAIKALFAKDPKLMFNDKDINKYYGEQPDLAKILKLLLQYIPTLRIPRDQIWQGDFLFDKSTLTTEKDYYSFHPNTIVYKVDKNSEIGKKFASADIGIVWLTRYMGKSLSEISAKYNTKTTELNDNPKVFMTDPYIASLAGYVTLTEEENSDFKEKIEKIEKIAQNLYKSRDYNKIINDEEIISLFKIFQNSLIKQDIKIEDTHKFLEEFIKFVTKKYKKEIFLRKTPKAQEALKKKLSSLIKRICDMSNDFETIIGLILIITTLKNTFIKKLNNIDKFETFLETNSGRFISTGDEGFAVSDISGNIVKLIDRYEFSFANFSPTIKKGWLKQ